jgi:phosphatidate cytidylyltransferase
MLKTRLLTVLVAVVLFAPLAAWASPLVLTLVFGLISGLILWEWLGLLAVSPAVRWLGLSAWAGLALGVLLDPWLLQTTWVMGLLGWVGLVWLLAIPVALYRAKTPTGLVAALISLWLMLGAWLSIWWALEESLGFLVSIFALTWIADTAAYFGGRAFGRHKLAPQISPGKTREGAVAAVLANLLFLWLGAHWWQGSFVQLVWQALGPWLASGAMLLLTLVSVMGDLHQSLLKRQAGVKDSGHLLPGHGGFFDRFDALVAVTPVSVLLVMVISHQVH